MSFEFCSFSSGSSGNSYLVRSERTALLVDAGISGKKIFEGLEATGTDRDMVRGILITHEHSDHIRSLRIVTKKTPAALVCSNFATLKYIEDMVPEERRLTFDSGEDFEIGDIKIRSFRTSHDAAEPVGYSFFNGGRQISILTDTGYVSEEAFAEIKNADLLALEANHDVNVLQVCRYPYYVKRRIAGDKGHLSNEAAAECICRLIEEDDRERHILLSHLSKENNSPEMAEITIKNILEDAGVAGGSKMRLDVITRDCVSPLFEV